jgi:arginine repressor
VNKSQAVREYLKAHPGAKSSEVAAALTKKGITITQNHVATIKTKLKNVRLAKKAAAQTVAVSASPAVSAEAGPTKSSDALTIQHVKAARRSPKRSRPSVALIA